MANKTLKSDNAVWLDIRVKRNDSFGGTVVLRENGSLYTFASTFATAKMQVKTGSESTTSLLELLSTATEIVFNDSGQVTFDKGATDMNIEPGKYVYDVEFTTSGGDVETMIEGSFIVTADTTR